MVVSLIFSCCSSTISFLSVDRASCRYCRTWRKSLGTFDCSSSISLLRASSSPNRSLRFATSDSDASTLEVRPLTTAPRIDADSITACRPSRKDRSALKPTKIAKTRTPSDNASIVNAIRSKAHQNHVGPDALTSSPNVTSQASHDITVTLG